MKAVQLSCFGGPDVFDVVEMPTPQPQQGEVLVRVGAAGVNFFEVLMRGDRYAVTPELPMVFGVEVAGQIAAVGAGVDRAVIGTRVAVPMFAFGRGSGGYAESIAIDAGATVPLPDDVTFAQAAALMVQGLTALHLVRQSPPRDRTVVVTAAAGGVGSLLLQLAKAAGARQVIAAAGSQHKRDLALGLGADVAVDYTATGWHEQVRDATKGVGADIVYDVVGGALTKSCLDALAPGGELVFTAMGRFDLVSADLDVLLSHNQSLKGFALLPLLTPANVKADLADMFARVADGRLRVLPGERFPLAQAAEAHRLLESRGSTGKVVLVP